MADTPQTYDLFTTDGVVRFRWALSDEGVRLGPDALEVMREGRWTRTPFTDIASVTLSSATAGRTILAQCIIGLQDGGRILISNAAKSGVANGTHDQPFRAFVRDFHRALTASGAATSINFNAGYSESRATGLSIALILFVTLMVGVPLILLLATRSLAVLGILFAGSLLVWPFLRVLRDNRPRTYAPAAPPDLVP